jgi:hypothetical protein
VYQFGWRRAQFLSTVAVGQEDGGDLKIRIDGKCSCLLGEPSKRIVGSKILRFSVKYDIIYRSYKRCFITR